MDINEILNEYDSMFGNKSLDEIETYLIHKLYIAEKNGRKDIQITLLNEIIGFCRDTTQKDKAISYSDKLINILNQLKLEGRVDYATSLLNIANAYRAFGLFEKSQNYYEQVLGIYKEKLHKNDFNYASLYNNWGLLYQEMGQWDKAKKVLLLALGIVDTYEEALIPQATTRTNLAATIIAMGDKECYDDAMEYLKEALKVYEQDGGKDFHYGAALVAMGDVKSALKDYGEAELYYEKGLAEIEKHVGKTDNYNRVLEKIKDVKLLTEKNDGSGIVRDEIWKNNLHCSSIFFKEYGMPMLKEKFSEYLDRIAVGMVGEGSDCYGFDDEISADHDYGLGFCIWLTDEDYKVIGEDMQKAYDNLFDHEIKSMKNDFFHNRRGVTTVNSFYNKLLNTSNNYEDDFLLDYRLIDETALSVATNGEVFWDGLGLFSKIREKLLEYYPEKIWRAKLAQCVHDYSQYAQSNYPRMMAREDYTTAVLCVNKAVETVMDMVYLINRRYSPYYKWKRRGMNHMSLLSELGDMIDVLIELPIQKNAWKNISYTSQSINYDDKCIVLFEKIADRVLEELRYQKIISGSDKFLEVYVNQILKGVKMELVDKIIQIEWKQFDKVKNEGGRADCQDDFDTFSIMRKSQYLAWGEELLESYLSDLQIAESKGWNMIMEKYARMMESTCPDRYDELKGDLPQLTEDRIAIQEEIIRIQVSWMEDFAENYPKMAGNARSIRTSEDNSYNTSYETYLRGEMSTYSERTFRMYGAFVVDLLKTGDNLAYRIMDNTAKLYGYDSLEEAERRL